MDAFLEKFLCRCTNPNQPAGELVGAAGDVFSGLRTRCGVAWDDDQPPVAVPYASSRVPGAGGAPAGYAADVRLGPQQISPASLADASKPAAGAQQANNGSAGGAGGAAGSTERSQSPLGTARSDAGESAASDMSLEEKAREKSRLQRLLKDFAKESVAGIPVSLVTPDAGRRSPYFFQMDRQLTVFSMRPGDGSTAESMAQDFYVKDIASIYKGPEVIAKAPFLGSAANACVGLTTSKDCRLFFHFDDNYERDRFYTCLQILRMSVDINGFA